MKSKDDVDSGMIALIGVIGSIFLFVVIVVLMAWFKNVQDKELYAKNAAEPFGDLMKNRADQLEQINGYSLVDSEKGIVTVPIDRAMELVVKDYSEGSGGN